MYIKSSRYFSRHFGKDADITLKTTCLRGNLKANEGEFDDKNSKFGLKTFQEYNMYEDVIWHQIFVTYISTTETNFPTSAYLKTKCLFIPPRYGRGFG